MRLVTVVGEPASGKSTLVKLFIETMGGVDGSMSSQVGMIKFHEFSGEKLVVIGDYHFGLSRFPGTDKLSMQASNHFPELLSVMSRGAWKDFTVLWEGDRLSGKKLLDSLADRYDMTVIKLNVPEAVIKQRHRFRGDNQSKRFIDGRRTKVENLVDFLPDTVKREFYENTNRGDLFVLLERLKDLCLRGVV